FNAWEQVTYDENDTVLTSRWYAERQRPEASTADRRAAALASAHANTPARTFLDALGRPFLTVADNGPRGPRPTRVELDVQGVQRSVTDARSVVVQTILADVQG